MHSEAVSCVDDDLYFALVGNCGCKYGGIYLRAEQLADSPRSDDKLMELVVERMKKLRSERGYSQEYVIEHTKLNISQYEARINYPSLPSLSVLCEFYEITLDEFFAPLNYPPKK